MQIWKTLLVLEHKDEGIFENWKLILLKILEERVSNVCIFVCN